jgi:hypothetical protein
VDNIPERQRAEEGAVRWKGKTGDYAPTISTVPIQCSRFVIAGSEANSGSASDAMKYMRKTTKREGMM